EGEHFVDDALGQVRVDVFDRLQNAVFRRRADVVEDVRGHLDAADLAPLDLFVAGQHLQQHVVQLAQRGGLDAIERGNPQHDVGADPVRQVVQHGRAHVGLQVHQNGGDDLRVLVTDQLGHTGRIHPLQAFNAGGVAGIHDA